MNEKNIYSVQKKMLKNGLTVLAYPTHTIPKVSAQLWYNVGSKHEQTGERGLAHFLEHLIFKGTQRLSESDLTMIVHKLSGYCNAFTSYDYTGYLFDFPKKNWETSLDLFADCMVNCSFKQDHINSELKAVIQELKLYNDDYTSTLLERMISTIFSDHPYHHPIIGYKQDLWSITQDSLRSFYTKYYTPHNATLVVVGDITAQEVYDKAEQYLGVLPVQEPIKEPLFYHRSDIATTATTLYRDVQQATGALCFIIPGLSKGQAELARLASYIIGSGRSSRLYKKLVEELSLVSHVDIMIDDLFEHGLFFIIFYPHDHAKISDINQYIKEELQHVIMQGFSDEEYLRASKRVDIDYLNAREINQDFAYSIGHHYLATKNEQYLFEIHERLFLDCKDELSRFIKEYLRPLRAHEGSVVPLSEKESLIWEKMQEESDTLDENFLSRKQRTEPVEPGKFVHSVQTHAPELFIYPRAIKHRLPNGITVLHHEDHRISKIEIILDLKSYYAYDPEDKQGLLYFTSLLLAEGTQKHSAQIFAEKIESMGISLEIKPGFIAMSVLQEDFEYALSLLQEMLMEPLFSENGIEKIRAQMMANLKNYWDSPLDYMEDVASHIVYKGHPHHKNKLGTKESISSITYEDILNCYKKLISPQDARLVIVGNTQGYDVVSVIEKQLGGWQGVYIDDLDYPIIHTPATVVETFPVKRDQVAFGITGLSVSHIDPRYDAMLLFDQIVAGGLSGSMSSRLFMLREQSGLFYSIMGSFVSKASVEPGMMLLRTLVSRDRLVEAEKAIKSTILDARSTIEEVELQEAKNALIYGVVDNFATYYNTALSLLFIEKCGFGDDYFDRRTEVINNISRQDVERAAQEIVNPDHLVSIRIGRI